MSEPVYSFRTAVGGFHKGDVVTYLTREAQSHRQALEAKDREIQALKAELAARASQQNPLPQSAGEDSGSSPANPLSPEEPHTQELLAYRRAEATERRAAQKVHGLYAQVDRILRQCAGEAEAACEGSKEALTEVIRQLAQVEQQVKALFQGLEQSGQTLRGLADTLPDPAEEEGL